LLHGGSDITLFFSGYMVDVLHYIGAFLISWGIFRCVGVEIQMMWVPGLLWAFTDPLLMYLLVFLGIRRRKMDIQKVLRNLMILSITAQVMIIVGVPLALEPASTGIAPFFLNAFFFIPSINFVVSVNLIMLKASKAYADVNYEQDVRDLPPLGGC